MVSNNKGKGLSEEEVKRVPSRQEQQAVGSKQILLYGLLMSFVINIGL